jgi:hypothetical protein
MTIEASEVGSQKKHFVLITEFPNSRHNSETVIYFSQVSNKNCKTIDEE